MKPMVGGATFGLGAIVCAVAATLAAPAGASGCATDQVYRIGSADRAYYGVVQQTAVAYRVPGGAPVQRFGRLNVNGAQNAFGIIGAVLGRDCGARWYRVQLPIRPNGATGYIRAADVWVGVVTNHVVVDLSERRLRFYRGKRLALTARVAIGTPSTPTPTGRYYVNQKLRDVNPNGPFGPGGIGISAFSPTLLDWPQGGPVAIHGTNQPELIGQAVSNGCVRVRNDVLLRLWREVPVGTPVIIRP